MAWMIWKEVIMTGGPTSCWRKCQRRWYARSEIVKKMARRLCKKSKIKNLLGWRLHPNKAQRIHRPYIIQWQTGSCIWTQVRSSRSLTPSHWHSWHPAVRDLKASDQSWWWSSARGSDITSFKSRVRQGWRSHAGGHFKDCKEECHQVHFD